MRERRQRDEPHSVRFRWPRCWFLPLAQVCPTAMSPPAPHHRACARCIVRIDVYGSSVRVKDASPERIARFFVPAPGARALVARARRRSPPRRPKDIRCHRRVAAVEEPRRSNGPTKIHVPTEPREGSCLPVDRDAFHRIEREGTGFARRDCSLLPSRRLSRSRRPHLVLLSERGALDGHCKVTLQSPANP